MEVSRRWATVREVTKSYRLKGTSGDHLGQFAAKAGFLK